MLKDYLSVGQIVGTHGVRGEMRVQPWCDTPDFLKQFSTLYYDPRGERSVKVVSARVHGAVVLLTLEGVDTMEKASSLSGVLLFHIPAMSPWTTPIWKLFLYVSFEPLMLFANFLSGVDMASHATWPSQDTALTGVINALWI